MASSSSSFSIMHKIVQTGSEQQYSTRPGKTQYRKALILVLGSFKDAKEIEADYNPEFKLQKNCQTKLVIIKTVNDLFNLLEKRNAEIQEFLLDYKTKEDLFIIEAHGYQFKGNLGGDGVSFELEDPKKLAEWVMESCPHLTTLKIKNLACYAAKSNFWHEFSEGLEQLKYDNHKLRIIEYIASKTVTTQGRSTLPDKKLVEQNSDPKKQVKLTFERQVISIPSSSEQTTTPSSISQKKHTFHQTAGSIAKRKKPQLHQIKLAPIAGGMRVNQAPSFRPMFAILKKEKTNDTNSSSTPSPGC